jgi:hypothetical protein
MFERTLLLWRRLVGSRARKPTWGADNQDRRVWVRFPADLEATLQPAGASSPIRLSAVVRDISVGGLSLLTDRTFAPGDLLAVELPGPSADAAITALACVVHTSPQEAGQWVVGCTFARELTNDDLAPFGARRTRPQASDPRSWDRYSCDVQASYQLAMSPEAGQRPATVLNISANGVGLEVEEGIDTGTLLNVALRSPTRPGGKTMLACVVHMAPQGEGKRALGCNFITELTESELLALL